jgi:RNA polymerase-binding protein DksA
VNKKEIAVFRGLLFALRRKLSNNVSHIETEALRTGSEAAAELSDVPVEHLADRGTENFARDMMISILQNSEAEIHDIDTALDKIDAGTFGKCESCGGAIPRVRLKALPFARLCIECKQSQESQAVRG